MHPIAFIGGAITGAAGLLAAALWDSKRTEAQYSPLLKTPGLMDAAQVSEELNKYFFAAQRLYGKCNEIIIKSSELIFTPVQLPDDSIFQRAGNMLGGNANLLCRRMRESDLDDLKEEAAQLYRRYLPAFERGNELLENRGKSPVSLAGIKFPAHIAKIDNSLENDDWDLELEEKADAIRHFIDQSCEAAEEIMQRLDSKEYMKEISS